MKKKHIIISTLSFIVFIGAIWLLKTNYPEDIVKPSPELKQSPATPPAATQSIPAATQSTPDTDLLSSPEVPQNTPRISSSVVDNGVRKFDSVEEYESASKYGRLPNSLSGINIKWDLNTDNNGKLIVSTDMRDFFEFFLSAQTEEGVETSIGRIEEYIGFVLPNAAAKEALDIFQAYLEYKKQLTRFALPEDRTVTGDQKADLISTIADVKAALNERINLRRQYLSNEVADIFFGDSEATDLLTIQRLEIETNDSISEAEKEATIAELPFHIKEFTINNQIEILKAQGGNEEKIHSLRVNLYGEENADILAGADRAESEWRRRIQNYNETKEKLMLRSDLTNAEKKSMIEEIKRGSFSEEELLEIRLLESHENLGDKS